MVHFCVKVELLSRLRSPYLLGLVGHCSDSNHRLLVYEFMANGNLQEHLYPARGMCMPSYFKLYMVKKLENFFPTLVLFLSNEFCNADSSLL